MRMHDKCLPCVVNQAIKVANITGINTKEELLREVFAYLCKASYDTSTPEFIGDIYDMIKNIPRIQIHIRKPGITTTLCS